MKRVCKINTQYLVCSKIITLIKLVVYFLNSRYTTYFLRSEATTLVKACNYDRLPSENYHNYVIVIFKM